MSAALADDAPRGFVPMREYLRLQRRCDELEERIAELSEAERDTIDAALIWTARNRLRLTEQECKVVLFLVGCRAPALRADIAEASNMGNSEGQLSVVTHKINRKLSVDGAPAYCVRGFYGSGGRYGLTEQGREWLKERIPEAFKQGAKP